MQRNREEIFRAAVQIYCAYITAQADMDRSVWAASVREAIEIDDAVRAACPREMETEIGRRAQRLSAAMPTEGEQSW